LKILDLRRNKLAGLQGISNMPELEALYLAENKIKSLTGLEGCPNLKILHLRKNVIVNFDEQFPLLEGLTYLNLRENLIEKI
jgi:Leucine-rich repeat (LRR) protein